MRICPLILLLLTGCTVVYPVNQVSPPLPTEAVNRQVATINPRAQSQAVTPPDVHLNFWWDYETPMPADNVSFVLQGTTNLVDWYDIIDTNQPPVAYDSFKLYEFYRVGAHWIVAPPD